MEKRAADDVPSYGLLVINHAYNKGRLTFKEWLELSREWALKITKQYGGETALRPSSLTTTMCLPTVIK